MDKLREECGLVGISSNEYQPMGMKIFDGLMSVQHRGQEAAGIAVYHEGVMTYYKNTGLASEVFNQENLRPLNGSIGIGHVRYSTTGSQERKNAQPLVVDFKGGSMALVHNGNLINAVKIREELIEEGHSFTTTIDSEVIVRLLSKKYKNDGLKALIETLKRIKGGFALILILDGKMYGVRDPHALRPLVMGRTKDNEIVFASETCTLDLLEAEYIKDLEKGEIVEVTGSDYRSIIYDDTKRRAVCSFEYVYFSRPDSRQEGRSVYEARVRMGELLAKKDTGDYDLVAPVPDSGIPAAVGYAKAAGLPYTHTLIKNKYIGRTFMDPTQEGRERMLRLKLGIIEETVKDKRILLVDDSIVRSTTMRRLVERLKEAGAKEVHVRSCSPPVKYSCYFGIDTPLKKLLIGANYEVDMIAKHIRADSLKYLDNEDLIEAIGIPKDELCRACFDGEYPMEVPRVQSRYVFEKF